MESGTFRVGISRRGHDPLWKPDELRDRYFTLLGGTGRVVLSTEVGTWDDNSEEEQAGVEVWPADPQVNREHLPHSNDAIKWRILLAPSPHEWAAIGLTTNSRTVLVTQGDHDRQKERRLGTGEFAWTAAGDGLGGFVFPRGASGPALRVKFSGHSLQLSKVQSDRPMDGVFGSGQVCIVSGQSAYVVEPSDDGTRELRSTTPVGEWYETESGSLTVGRKMTVRGGNSVVVNYFADDTYTPE